MYEFKKECSAMLVTFVTKIQERSQLKYNFVRKLASLNPRLIIVEPDTAVQMFKQVLTKLVDTGWRTTAASCSNANYRYKMYIMDKDKETQEPGKVRKKSSLTPLLCKVLVQDP